MGTGARRVECVCVCVCACVCVCVCVCARAPSHACKAMCGQRVCILYKQALVNGQAVQPQFADEAPLPTPVPCKPASPHARTLKHTPQEPPSPQKKPGTPKTSNVPTRRGRNEAAEAADRERFLQELEEDPDMRQRVNIYKDADALQALQARQAAAAAAAGAAGQQQQQARRHAVAGLESESEEEDEDGEGLPEVGAGWGGWRGARVGGGARGGAVAGVCGAAIGGAGELQLHCRGSSHRRPPRRPAPLPHL
jgi:hypothetical protein